MLKPKDLSKLGIGTWGLGGLVERDHLLDVSMQAEAVAYTLKSGVNYLESTLFYAEGAACEVAADALSLSGVSRNNVFISQTIYPYKVKSIKQAQAETKKFMSIFGVSSLDAVQVSANFVTEVGYEKVRDYLLELIGSGVARYISTTNANVKLLTRFKNDYPTNFFAHEVHLSFEVRLNEDEGIIEYANKNNIKNIIFQPLRRNRTAAHNWPLLVELSKKYGKTQNQIILRWLTQKNYLPLIKATSKSHIDENLAALEFVLDNNDIGKLDSWRLSGAKWPKIDWENVGDGESIWTVPNDVDDLINTT